MIVQNVSADGTTDMTFTVARRTCRARAAALAEHQDQINWAALLDDPDVAKISVVGVGMRSHAGVASTMFSALADKAINIQVISTSEIKVSVLIARRIHRTGGARAAYRLWPRCLTTLDCRPGPERAPAPPELATSHRLCGRAVDCAVARGTDSWAAAYAIMGGAMSWVSERHLVAAISNAGGFGVIACGAMTPGQLAEQIAGTQALTDKPFGVNLITMHPQLDDLIRVTLEAKVGHIVLAGGIPPGAAVRAVKDGGAKLIAFAPALSLAKRLVRSGADAIVIEGSEAGGHIGPVSLTVLAQEILPHLREVPVFVAGGLGRGEAILAYLEMGASGAQIGTRFAAAAESIAHPNFKKAFIRANARDAMPSVRARSAPAGDPGARPAEPGDQAIPGASGGNAGQVRRRRVDQGRGAACHRAVLGRRAAARGDRGRRRDTGSVMAGQSVGMVTAEQPVAAIIQELVDQAVNALVARGLAKTTPR